MPRGGARENSGRKPKWNLGETKAIRVPVAIAETILEIARRLDEGETPESIVIPRAGVTIPEQSSEEWEKSKGHSESSSV
jgi:hypothetical protein